MSSMKNMPLLRSLIFILLWLAINITLLTELNLVDSNPAFSTNL